MKTWSSVSNSTLILPFIPYPFPLSLIPTPCFLSPSTVPFTKFRWGLLSFLRLWLWLSPAKVKSTPSPRPKTGVWQQPTTWSKDALNHLKWILKSTCFFALWDPQWVMGWLRGVIMGKSKFALKCFLGKIKCFKTMLVFFFLMENWGIEDPPSQLNGKFHYHFFWNHP